MMSETLVQTAYGKVQGVQEVAVSSPRLPQDTGGATREPLRLGADPGRTVDGGRLLVWNLVESSQPMVQRMVGDAPERLRLAHQMQRAWIVFALHGDPNTPELPTWPSYDLERRAIMLFDRESTVQNDPNAEARQVWEKVARSIGEAPQSPSHHVTLENE